MIEFGMSELGLLPEQILSYRQCEIEAIRNGMARKQERLIKNMHYQAWFNADYTANAVWNGSKSLPDLNKIMTTSIFEEEIPKSEEDNELIILNMLSNIQKNKSEFNIIIEDTVEVEE